MATASSNAVVIVTSNKLDVSSSELVDVDDSRRRLYEEWARYLPNVLDAQRDGTWFASGGSSRTLPQTTPITIKPRNSPSQEKKKKNKQQKKNATTWSTSTQLIVRIGSKCLGSTAAPKDKQPSSASHHHPFPSGTASANNHQNIRRSTSQNQPHTSSSSSSSNGSSTAGGGGDHHHNTNDGASSAGTSGFLPRRFRKTIMRVQFRLPDFQLPSIPLPSLPTIHLPSWIASDPQQLEAAEEHLMAGCYYRQRTVAGMNTLIAMHHHHLGKSDGALGSLRYQREGTATATSSQMLNDEISTEVDYGDVPSSMFLPTTDNTGSSTMGLTTTSASIALATTTTSDGRIIEAPMNLTSPTSAMTPTARNHFTVRHARRQSEVLPFQAQDEKPLTPTIDFSLADKGHHNNSSSIGTGASLSLNVFMDFAKADDRKKHRRHADAKELVVLVHGFGGGSAMWAQNWEVLRDDGAVDLFAFDLPGFARSDRGIDVDGFTGPQDSIDYYCRKFAEWFEEMEFDRPVILCGHSFGAYLSSFFVTHYFSNILQRSIGGDGADSSVPLRPLPLQGKRCEDVVKHLVLADPWGIELIPREFMKKEMRHLSTRDRLIAKLFYYFTPLGGLRAAGPIGPKLVPAIRPDLAEGWMGEQREKFFHYIYHCNAQEPPSGELAFRSCVAYAGHPRVAAGPQLLASLPDCVGLTFMYGQTTMMDAHAGYKLMEELWRRGHRRCRWVEISNAGHQIFSENAKEFNFEMAKVINGERGRRHVTVPGV